MCAVLAGLVAGGAASPPSPPGLPAGYLVLLEGAEATKGRVVLLNSDGSDRKELTRAADVAGDPACSPDGVRIAYWSARTGDAEIYVLKTDGSNERNLTRMRRSWDTTSTWSPDGSRLAFVSNRAGHVDVWVMDSQGKGLKNLTGGKFESSDPAWSPDGAQIAFVSRHDNFTFQVYLMNADGSNPHALTDLGEDPDYPVWTPDGQRILYRGDRSRDLWSVSLKPPPPDVGAGEEEAVYPKPVRLIPRVASSAVFLPDGKHFLFLKEIQSSAGDSGRGEPVPSRPTEIWMADADGKNAVKLGIPPGDYRALCWLKG